MVDYYKLNAELRTDLQKGATKRLRRAGLVPAVYYHHTEKPVSLSLNLKELKAALRSSARIYDLDINKKSHKCIVRDVQFDPISEEIIHADFMGVSLEEMVTVSIPINVAGIAVGVKTFGGILEQHLWELEVKCKASQIPDKITVEVTNLNLGDSINVSSIKIEGVEILTPATTSIVSVVLPTGTKVEEEAVKEEGAEEAEAEETAETKEVKETKGKAEK
ncbi:MAG TPA: 50S ribosomal protein L25 [Candidatus Marinimicrobia bacterium]|nr:50S ribosomal protein L25 [Candidatus Neomarinimicrobiota bacterium]HRS52256.1 50S ribosomal protein L25 [Candidatus Neomarinimicrobiota bacterium]HRU91943.1 50S ribosomal protein L25 [Candidatus Neomarinimicrobiota bacterium]